MIIIGEISLLVNLKFQPINIKIILLLYHVMIIIRDVPFPLNFMATIIMPIIRLSMIPKSTKPPITPPTIAGMLDRFSKGTKGVCVCVCECRT